MGFFSKIKEALSSTSNKISSGVTKIFTHKKLDSVSLEELEELLITSDMGAVVSADIIDQLKKHKFEKDGDASLIILKISKIIEEILSQNQKPFELDNNQLNIILICGVNGNGKTTSIGKLAAKYKAEGKKVMVAACDTFRAAAVDQLRVWTDRAGVDLIEGAPGADPASVAYKATEQALASGADILFIDTAGRLQNQQNLMEELAKIKKVIAKAAGFEPGHNMMVLDATTGQNAMSQLEQFKKIVDIDGLIVTKLDGTSKAGVIIGLSQKYQVPVYFIGLGEKLDDLKEFHTSDFAKALVGYEG
jgi:fused signal recognition particle receptor